MKSFEVRRQIAAPPQTVWNVLTDRIMLTDGSFGILRLEGEIAGGQQIRLWSEVSPNRAFLLTVSKFELPRRMVWSGGMPLGLFSGRRTFGLEPAAGGTAFHLREEFSGIMSAMIVGSMPDLTPSFEKFGNALKQKAERLAR